MSMNLKEALEKEEGKNKKPAEQVGEQEQPKAAKKAVEKIKEEIEKIDSEKEMTKAEEKKSGLFNFKEENDFMPRIVKLHFYGKNRLSTPKKDYILNKPIKDIEEGDNEEKIGIYILNAFIQKAMESIPFTPLTDTTELINSAIETADNDLFKVVSLIDDKITIKIYDSELTFILVE